MARPTAWAEAVDLILWRHADAGDAVEGPADLQRPLTPKGDKQAAKEMTVFLRRLKPAEQTPADKDTN